MGPEVYTALTEDEPHAGLKNRPAAAAAAPSPDDVGDATTELYSSSTTCRS